MAEKSLLELVRAGFALARHCPETMPLHEWMGLPEDDPRVAEAAARLAEQWEGDR